MINTLLKPNTDNYRLDEITCFEKPVGIILDSYNKSLSNIFYSVIKLIEFYNIDEISYDLKSHKNILHLYKKIIEEIFELDCTIININSNFHNIIEDNIKNYNRILIPGNLKNLYYSNHYKSSDWPHLFLISGYDSQKKLYNILDYSHIQSDKIIYLPFLMEYKVLEELYKSSVNSFDLAEVLIIKKNLNNEFNIAKIVKKILDIYNKLSFKQPYKILNKIEYVNNIIDNIEDSNDIKSICKYIINLTKYNDIFLKELTTSLLYLNINKDESDYINNIRLLLKTNWENLSNKTILAFLKGRKFDATPKILDILKIEEELRILLSKVYTEIEKFNIPNNYIKNLCNSYYYTNNEDNIIKFNNNSLIFKFDKNNDYNCWFGDNSPKALMNFEKVNLLNFMFKSNLNIKNRNKNSKFLGGIIIKTFKSSIYYFGLNYDQTLVIDKKLDDSIFHKSKFKNSNINLKIQVNKKDCTFFYSEYNNSNNYKEFYKIKLDDFISEIGVSCKAWSCSNDLCLEFNDFKYINY